MARYKGKKSQIQQFGNRGDISNQNAKNNKTSKSF